MSSGVAALGIADVGGLRAAGVACGIKASGAPDVALLVADAPVHAAGLFATNAFSAAPVRLSRAHLERTGGRVGAVVVNSGNANACTGERGEEDARLMASEAARLVGCDVAEVIVCSTGVIGQHLPRARVLEGIGRAHAGLARGRDASAAFAEAIRTTDAFVKEASAEVALPRGVVRVAGACKGAGMIEPNMATMLAFVATDLVVPSADLAALAKDAAARSFNALHVDSHASTNDTFLLLATGASGVGVGDAAEAAAAVVAVCRRLAWLIARDGEGATKVTTVRVSGAPDEVAARDVARRLVHSGLVRTALFGRDPNWGRFVSAAGNSPFVPPGSALTCAVQGVQVFARGEPTPFDREGLREAMGREDVKIEIDLAAGQASAEVLTSDLGYRYVEINAEYTT